MMNNQYKRKFWMFPIFGAAFILIGGYVVMLLWNAILPGVIASVGTLTYLKAIGLLVLCKLLFGSFKGHSRHNGFGNGRYQNGMYWKEKMNHMTEEERTKFKAEWRARCGRKS